MTVLLHVGLFKTGTTSIQRWLRDHPDLLATHNARFPNGWLRRDCHLELHLALMRPDRTSSARLQGDEWRDHSWRAGLVTQVADDLARHPDELTVLSCEHTSLLRYDDEIGPLRELVGDARVVVYFRERDAFLASMTDQLVKNNLEPSDDPDSFAYVKPDSWRVDYDGFLATWRRYFSTVLPVDYDCVTRWDGSVIPSFARLLGIGPTELPADVDGYWLNQRGAVDPRVPGNRWTSGARFGEDPDPRPPEG